MDGITAHQNDVRALSKQVETFHKAGTRIRIYHGSTNSTRLQKFDPEKTIDLSRLNRILEINIQEDYALVEPNVPMDMLVKATVRHGLIPPVVMEFPGITTGGVFRGAQEKAALSKRDYSTKIASSTK